MAITASQRKEAELLVYSVMDALDASRTVSDHYKMIFNKMTDKQFEDFFKEEYPLRFHTSMDEINPTISGIEKGYKLIGQKLIQPIRTPHIFEDSKGRAVKTQECMVGYIHLRKEQQLMTRKNAVSISIDNRDARTGLLQGGDKNGGTSDREAESLIINGLTNTYDELMGARADSMGEKSNMYGAISTNGTVSLKDIKTKDDGSLSRQSLDMLLLGAGISSNTLLNNDNYLQYTLNDRQRNISR